MLKPYFSVYRKKGVKYFAALRGAARVVTQFNNVKYRGSLSRVHIDRTATAPGLEYRVCLDPA